MYMLRGCYHHHRTISLLNKSAFFGLGEKKFVLSIPITVGLAFSRVLLNPRRTVFELGLLSQDQSYGAMQRAYCG